MPRSTYTRKCKALWLLVTLFALPSHSSEDDSGSEGSICDSSEDCNVGLVCSNAGICVPEVIEEIVVVAPAPRPIATRPFFTRPAPTPPPDPTGPFLPPVIIVPTNPFDQDDDNQIDCWSLLTGDASAVISSGEGYRNHPITGDRRYHNGIDIEVASGTIVRAAQQGTIVQVVNSYRVGTGAGGGNLVRINYTDGTQGVYLHLLRTAVSVGASVSPGDIVGTADDTGDSTGPHLHYSIWKKHNHTNLSALDPANFYDPEERYGSSCS